MSQQTASFPLGGGMDLITPMLSKPPGRVIASLNYEPVAAGYRRLTGFERYDGQAAPSGVEGWDVFHFTNGNNNLLAIMQGSDLRTGTGYRGWALGPAVITGGDPALGTAVGYVGTTHYAQARVASGLPSSLNLQGTGSCGTATTQVLDEAVPEAANGAWLAAAKAVRRSKIAAVPGEGPVRGVWRNGENIVAIRDNVGATAGVMHLNNLLSGWVPVNLSKTFTFDSGGTFEPVPGDGISGETSLASGWITGITLTSGTWAGGDAAGSMTILLSGGGAFQNGETCVVRDHTPLVAPPPTYPNNLTLTSAGTAYVLPDGGTYEFINHNFYGASDLARIYGVNGAGQAFVYDPTASTLAPISTGMTDDTPNHIAAYRGSLFLSFEGGSVQFSSPGEPLLFDPIIGAGEIGAGSDIVAMIPTAGALAILACDSINMLYGSDASDYQLEVLTHEAGALTGTAEKAGDVIYMDNRGLRSLRASRDYGNFTMNTISRLIAPLLEDYHRDGIHPVASLVARASDQYWVFFNNGTGLVVYLGKKAPEILPINIGKTVTCAASVEDDGDERLFIGCDDGFVYELNKGTSFDGEVIEHYIRLPFNHFNRPEYNKVVKSAHIDIQASGTTTLGISAEYNLGSVPGSTTQAAVITTGGAAIDDLGSNELYFASQIEAHAEVYLDNICQNVSLKIGGSTSTEEPHTLTGVTYHILMRGMAT